METPNWRQNLHERVRRIDYRDALTYAGSAVIYLVAIVMIVILPLKLLPVTPHSKNRVDPNVKSNNNYLPSYCPLYTTLANEYGLPLSEGPLRLPFQRPVIECRTFTSLAMEKLITNITLRMVDKDLARLFENAYPNTLGPLSQDCANIRYNDILVQS
jgi:hypothetical protein